MNTTSKSITKIVVSLSRRRLTAYSVNEQIFDFDCVIGREGHETVPGFFHIFSKELMHLSHSYDNTPMPFTMFFSSDGKAIHGTYLAGLRSYASYVGLGSITPLTDSHGCVGLKNSDAEALYKITPIHTLIEIQH